METRRAASGVLLLAAGLRALRNERLAVVVLPLPHRQSVRGFQVKTHIHVHTHTHAHTHTQPCRVVSQFA